MKVKLYSYPAGQSLINKSASLSRFFKGAWAQKLHDGTMKYPPPRQRLRVGRFEVALNPGRLSKPCPLIDEGALIAEPHKACVFDNPKVAANEAVMRVEALDQEYLLYVNIFPIFWDSFLLVRAAVSPQDRLSQYVKQPEDLLDLILISKAFPKKLRFLFNSNPGGKTDGAASKNHFHLHVAPLGQPLYGRSMAPLAEMEGGIRYGKIPDWPPNIRILEGTDDWAAAQLSFRYIDALNSRNNAYNLVFMRYGEDRERIVLIPRTKGAPDALFYGFSSQKWGGDHHCGSIAEFDENAFSLMHKKPGEAEKMMAQRMRETTFSDEDIKELDFYMGVRETK